MRIALLSSSRADFGIYLPLIRQILKEGRWDLHVIAFGTHVSTFHGYTLDQIEAEDIPQITSIESMVLGDSPSAISAAIGLTQVRFASLWEGIQSETDLILCLGDRYEMFAAVSAALPFNIPIAHIHGGEVTLGAIDNTLRNGLTMMARYHFVSTEAYAANVARMTGTDEHIWYVGALSLDNLSAQPRLSKAAFLEKFGIDLDRPTLLVTLHPETQAPERNGPLVRELTQALRQLIQFQIVITMPNADTHGNQIRRTLTACIEAESHIVGVENFGTQAYFSIMEQCQLMIGNSSSGILEAASFGKYVLNLGLRQKGRACSENVRHLESVSAEAILQQVQQLVGLGSYTGPNVYWNGGARQAIIKALEQIHAKESIPLNNPDQTQTQTPFHTQ